MANFVTYGIADLHPHVTLTGHVYGARGVYASARQLSAWSPRAREVLRSAVAAAVTQQRTDAAHTETELRHRLARDGTHIVALTAAEHAAFRAVAEPVLAHAWSHFDDAIVQLVRAG